MMMIMRRIFYDEMHMCHSCYKQESLIVGVLLPQDMFQLFFPIVVDIDAIVPTSTSLRSLR